MGEKDPEFALRLDSITTRWSLVRRAHAGTETTMVDARQTLVLRYSAAIRNYLRAMTRSEEQADEVSQDVVVRLLKGDFAGANPNRGRFRDLMKTAVRNMVRNFWDREGRRRGANVDVAQLPVVSESDQEDSWTAAWRRNGLDLTWAALEDYQRAHPGSQAYTLLRLRVDHSDDTSDQMAERLSEKTGRPMRADSVRQQLRRARVRFAELLVQEIADGLEEPTPDTIQEELIGLGLFEYVRDIVPPDWGVRDGATGP